MRICKVLDLVGRYLDLLAVLGDTQVYSGMHKLYQCHTGIGLRPLADEAAFIDSCRPASSTMRDYIQACIRRNIHAYAHLLVSGIRESIANPSADQFFLSSSATGNLAALCRFINADAGPHRDRRILTSIEAVAHQLTGERQFYEQAGLKDTGHAPENADCNAVVAMYVQSLDVLFDMMDDQPYHLYHLRALRILYEILCHYNPKDSHAVHRDEYFDGNRRLLDLHLSTSTLAAGPVPTTDVVRWLMEPEAAVVSSAGAAYIKAASRFVTQ